MKKTFKMAIALIAVLSLFPGAIKAANNIDSLLFQLEYAKDAEQYAEIKTDIEALVSTDEKAANVALDASYGKNNHYLYTCTLIDALSSSKDSAILKGLANHINSRDENIKLCASKSAAQNSDDATIDALFFNIDEYMAQTINKGPYEENLKSKLAAIDSIWALGEIGNPKILRGLKLIYAKSDEVLKVNVIISIGKTKSPEAIKMLKNIANSKEADIIRATAWEMIDYITVEEEQWGF